MNVTAVVNPSADYARAAAEGRAFHNQAHALEQRGDFAGAEALFLRAIDVKEQGLGPGNLFTANSQNALGELYLKLERLDEAENMLKRALDIRKVTGTAFDAAVTRENLGQMYEMKSMLSEAKDIRLESAATGAMACGNYHCPKLVFKRKELQNCGGCRAVFYCSKPCQAADWKERHKKYCNKAKANV